MSSYCCYFCQVLAVILVSMLRDFNDVTLACDGCEFKAHINSQPQPLRLAEGYHKDAVVWTELWILLSCWFCWRGALAGLEQICVWGVTSLMLLSLVMMVLCRLTKSSVGHSKANDWRENTERMVVITLAGRKNCDSLNWERFCGSDII